ncbi:MAG: ADP-ribosylglycohydrolase family protein [Eubacterium sp.]|nr:ADP-ribosylglycohydrolase family protein [Eubacterium sp.]
MANKLSKKERFAGCMLGLALGDSLGYDVKGKSFKQIRKEYGKKGIMKPVRSKQTKSALVSDETQLMLFTAHGILWTCAVGGSTAADYTNNVFLALQQWLYTQTGSTASPAYDNILEAEGTEYPCALLDLDEIYKKRGPTKTLIQTLTAQAAMNYGSPGSHVNDSKLFDCVPRTAPAGLFFSCNPVLAFKTGCLFAAITHGNPTGYLAAGCFAAMLAYIVGGETIEKSALNCMKLLTEYDGYDECYTAINHALELIEDDDTSPLTAVGELGGGNTAESALAIGIYCAAAHYDFESAVQLAANQDGNSDACAAIAGALKGAYVGYHALPAKWISEVQLTATVKEYAVQLSKAAPKKA